MIQRNRWSAYLILAGLVAFSGCAKKTPGSAGGAAGSGDSDAAAGSESAVGGGTGAGGASSASGLPVVYFEFDQYTVRSEDAPLLQGAAETLQKGKSSKVTIEGHCDERGSVEYNLALGERRAQSVKSYLQKLGVEGKRLSVLSYGEERPADSTSGESAWTKNRRAEMVVNQ